MVTKARELSHEQSEFLLERHTETLVKAQYLYLVGWMDSLFASYAVKEEVPPEYFDLLLQRQYGDTYFDRLFDGLDEVVYRHIPNVKLESLKAWNDERHTPFEAACVYYAAKWWDKFGSPSANHGEQSATESADEAVESLSVGVSSNSLYGEEPRP